MVMVPSSGKIVKSESTSRLFIYKLLNCSTSSLAKERESLVVNLSIVKLYQLSVVNYEK